MSDLVPPTHSAAIQSLIRSIQVVNPSTGELVDLDGPDEQLAEFMADMREHESLCREMKSIVTREWLARRDREARWTVHVAGLEISVPSPAPTEEFDGPALHEALAPLVDDGTISIEALDAAVETVVTYVPRRKGITALRRLGGRVAEIVSAHATEVQKPRYAKVSRS